MNKRILSIIFLLLAALPATSTRADVTGFTYAKAGAGLSAFVAGIGATIYSYKNKKKYRDELVKLKPVIQELIALEQKSKASGLTGQEETLRNDLNQKLNLSLEKLSIKNSDIKNLTDLSNLERTLKTKERKWLVATIGSLGLTTLGGFLGIWAIIDFCTKKSEIKKENIIVEEDDEEEGELEDDEEVEEDYDREVESEEEESDGDYEDDEEVEEGAEEDEEDSDDDGDDNLENSKEEDKSDDAENDDEEESDGDHENDEEVEEKTKEKTGKGPRYIRTVVLFKKERTDDEKSVEEKKESDGEEEVGSHDYEEELLDEIEPSDDEEGEDYEEEDVEDKEAELKKLREETTRKQKSEEQNITEEEIEKRAQEEQKLRIEAETEQRRINEEIEKQKQSAQELKKDEARIAKKQELEKLENWVTRGTNGEAHHTRSYFAQNSAPTILDDLDKLEKDTCGLDEEVLTGIDNLRHKMEIMKAEREAIHSIITNATILDEFPCEQEFHIDTRAFIANKRDNPARPQKNSKDYCEKMYRYQRQRLSKKGYPLSRLADGDLPKEILTCPSFNPYAVSADKQKILNQNKKYLNRLIRLGKKTERQKQKVKEEDYEDPEELDAKTIDRYKDIVHCDSSCNLYD